MKFLIVFVAVFLVCGETHGYVVENNFSQENSLESHNIQNSLENCEEQFCGRVYNPICMTINGEELTVSSLCQLANLRCKLLNLLSNKDEQKIPEFHIKHFGECVE